MHTLILNYYYEEEDDNDSDDDLVERNGQCTVL